MTATQRKMREWIMLIRGEDILKVLYPEYNTICVCYRNGTVQKMGLLNGVLLYDCDTDEVIATDEQIRYLKKVRRLQNENQRKNKSD